MHLVQNLLIFYIFISKSWANIPRPHGVDLAKVSLYQANTDGSWMCLDGKKNIKFTQINDEFCDCEDGSDEPGTSACPAGQFYCENHYHRAEYIASSHVNDGICDCCDGSDEFVKGEENICPNICVDLGRAALQERRLKEELHKRGASLKTKMISAGKQLKSEREARHIELQERRKEQEALKSEQEELKRQAEANEAAALEIYQSEQKQKEESENLAKESELNRAEAQTAFNTYDNNKDGFVDITELQMDIMLDRDNNGVVEITEAKFFLDEREQIDFDGFLTHTWPRIKSQQMLAKGLFEGKIGGSENIDNTHEEINQTPQENNHEQEELGEEEHGEHLDDEEGEGDDEEGYDDGEEADVGTGTVVETTNTPEYDPETQLLVDEANAARNSYNEVERVLRDIENEIKDLDAQIGKDYGVNDEYATLDGQCYTFEDREYVYTLCPFDRASQKQKNGHSETVLGRWDSWTGTTDKYTQMKYSHGTSCWNGPQRSAFVKLSCGLEEKILSVSEPNRCEYFIEFETVAACDDTNSTNDEHMRDEL